MKRDHRPYFLKHLDVRFQKWYVNHFLRPQFECLGKRTTFMKPWHVEIFGGAVSLGNYANVIAASDKKVRLTVWPNFGENGYIRIGDYCLICPGVRISAAMEIVIGDSCMIAHGAFITDSDWHDIYDRSISSSRAKAVNIGNNVWIGDSAIICKGVTIGENSIIGAGAVVTRNIPPNTIAAGNPAVVIRTLSSDRQIKTRAEWFSDPKYLSIQFREIDRDVLRGNTLFGWVRALLFPSKND